MPRRKPEETAGPAALLARQGEFTVAAAAKEIGRSPDTIRRWIRTGKVKARSVKCGEQTVSVFTFAEIRALKDFAKTVKIGRPPVGAAPMKQVAKKAPAKKAAAKKAPVKSTAKKAPVKAKAKTKVTPIPKATTSKRKAS